MSRLNDAKKLKNVILAAPDIDKDVYRFEIGPALVQLHIPVTLCASNRDMALLASKHIGDWPRAGDTVPPIILGDFVSIDASAIDTNFFWDVGHSYYADQWRMLDDIANTMNNVPISDRKYLIEARDPKQQPNIYYIFTVK